MLAEKLRFLNLDRIILRIQNKQMLTVRSLLNEPSLGVEKAWIPNLSINSEDTLSIFEVTILILVYIIDFPLWVTSLFSLKHFSLKHSLISTILSKCERHSKITDKSKQYLKLDPWNNTKFLKWVLLLLLDAILKLLW